MPDIRERDPSNKIKGKGRGGGQARKGVRRQLTAKFRKELTNRQRDGGREAPGTQAADQTEQIAVAAVEEVSEKAGRGVSRAVSAYQKGKRQRQLKQGQEEERGQQGAGTVPETDAAPDHDTFPAQGSARAQRYTSSADRAALPMEGSTHAPAAPPTPRERMRRQAVEERREQARHPRQTAPKQESISAGHSPHYGGFSPTPEIQKEHRALENQSINQSIKERPRRSTGPNEKPPGGAFTPKTRKRVEQAAEKAAATVKASTATGKAPATRKAVERARKKAQREAQREMARKTRQTAKAAADLSKRAVAATVNAANALIGGLAALVGGAVLVAALCVVILIAAIIASPFGILFSNEPSRDAVPLNAAVSQINMELTDKLAGLQSGDYDSIDFQGQAPNWREVVAVFAAKTAGADDGVDVAALTPDRVDRLRAIFWDMCAVHSQVETIEHPATNTTEAWTERVLHITITAKAADDMRTAYAFSDLQNQALTELLAELDTLGAMLDDLSVSQENALALLRGLPAGLDPEREAVVKTACQLVGKVNYFWGGCALFLDNLRGNTQ